MNYETIDLTTVVLPCQINGTHRITLPTADFEAGFFDKLSEEDYLALQDGVTPAERAAAAHLAFPMLADCAKDREETPEDQAIAAFMAERSELKSQRDAAMAGVEALGEALKQEIAGRASYEEGVLSVGAALAGSEAHCERLAREVRAVSDKAARQRKALREQNETIRYQEDVLVKAARYQVLALQRLAMLGIHVEPNEHGEPDLTVDLATLTERLSAALGV